MRYIQVPWLALSSLGESPEVGFAERLTADFIAHKLAEAEIEVHRDIGGAGIVGALRRRGSNRSIRLRAEMDALPMKEHNDFEHPSRHEGVMHACGHDGLTAMLLGAGHHLMRSGWFDGAVYLIFQPAEETGRGALAMLLTSYSTDPPAIRSMRCTIGRACPQGTFAVRKGAMMAAGGFFDIRLRGRAAHAACPEHGIDPIYAGSAIVAELKSLVSRTLPSIASCGDCDENSRRQRA